MNSRISLMHNWTAGHSKVTFVASVFFFHGYNGIGKMDVEIKSLVQQITLSSDIFESNSPLEVSRTIKIHIYTLLGV